MMQFRIATLHDLPEIMKIIAQGQEYLNSFGIPQWQDGYPSQAIIEGDIERGNSYVLVDGAEIFATTALEFEGGPNYDRIQAGNWLTTQAYGVIHRIAIDQGHKGKGFAAIMVGQMAEICRNRGVFSLRVDTHKNNQSMQRMLQKTGFHYCGVIFLADGAPRIAFEKILD